MNRGLRCAPPTPRQEQGYANLVGQFGSINPACWSWAVTPQDKADARNCPEHFAHVLLWNWQAGQCASCGIHARPGVRFVRDHDHETGLLRGLLCQRCNVLEGWIAAADKPGFTVLHGQGENKARRIDRWRDSDKTRLRAERLERYRAVTPAKLLGLVARHAATKAPAGLILPTRYERDLPIIDVEPGLWARFYRAVRTREQPDNRLSVLDQFMRTYVAD